MLCRVCAFAGLSGHMLPADAISTKIAWTGLNKVDEALNEYFAESHSLSKILRLIAIFEKLYVQKKNSF